MKVNPLRRFSDYVIDRAMDRLADRVADRIMERHGVEISKFITDITSTFAVVPFSQFGPPKPPEDPPRPGLRSV